MNATTEFDVGPLTWVKSEIDLALDRAAEALAQHATTGDATQLKFCRTHLHQVRGALAIVGLDGVTQFTDTLEALLEDVEAAKVPADSALIKDALDAVRHFLDDLVNGEHNQPLRLMPVYTRLQLARGHKKVAATDLFYPDLSLRPPRRQAAPALSKAELHVLLRNQRARFQRGLLAWLRNPGDKQGVAEMLAATRQVEATQELSSARAFWWVASGMLTALAEGSLAAEVDVKQLCARIDLQIRRLLEGSKNVAERLMRDALYYVAQADSGTGLVGEVKDTYQLGSMIPAVAPSASAEAEQNQLRRRLRDAISSTEEAWNKFCAGSAPALNTFRDQAAALHHLIDQLAHTDYRRLGQAIANAANWLAEQPSRHSEALAMEIATAILLANNAQENFTRLGNDFAHQVDVMVARLHGFLAGNPPEPGSEVPLLDEMSRQAQEKLLVGQVAKEIQSNLAQIEQVLDGFFRDAAKRGDLATLDAPMHQIVGALMIMGQDAAVATLKSCEADIRRFSDGSYVPDNADFERVADRLSALGFFIDSMQHGATDFAEFSRAMQAKPAVIEDEAEESSVERELEQAKRETQALITALKDQPADERLRQELKQNLETLKQDADLVADSALGQQAKAALSALDAGDSAPAIDEAIAIIKPQTPEAPTPSAETLQLAQADEEELDAELLAIFIEEAKEVLEAVGGNLAALREQPHNAETLTNIRRSFHTLKGSGRMVGLRELGEVAWGIEQVLNLWLRQEQDVTPAVFDMITEGHAVFSVWVEHLENRAMPLPDATHLIALAESLRIGGEVPPPVPVTAPSEESFDGETATVVLGTFGRDDAEETPAAPAEEVLDVPALVIEEAPPVTDEDSFEGAAATMVLGSFGREEDVAPATETVELPPISLVPSEPDLEAYEGASATVVVGRFGNNFDAQPPVEPEVTAVELPPIELAPTPEPGSPEYNAAATLVLRKFTTPEPPREPVEPALDIAPLELDEPVAPTEDELFDGASATVVIGNFGSEAIDLPDVDVPAEKVPQPEPVVEEVVTFEHAPEVAAAPSLDEIPAIPPASFAEVPAAEMLVEAGAEALGAFEPIESLEPPLEVPVQPLADFTEATPPENAEGPSEEEVGEGRLTISPTLYEIFLEEARGHLATLHREFAILDNDPGQPTAHQMARAAHTLAGIAGTVGLTDLNRLGVALEHALLRREVTDQPGSQAGIEAMRQSLAALDAMIDAVADHRMPKAMPELVVALDDIYPPPAQAAAEFADELVPQPEVAVTDATAEEVDALPVTAASAASASADVPATAAAAPIVVDIPSVKDELDEQLLPIFLEEAAELTLAINENLRSWRSAPGDATPLRALHRLFHTLKGSARMAGAMTLGEITHAIESRVEEADKAGAAPAGLIDEIENTFDSVVQIIERLQRGESLEAPVASADADTAVQVEDVTAQPFAQSVAASADAPAPLSAPAPVAAVAEAPAEGGEETAAQRAILRIRADLIDQLVNEAGELSIARARIEGEMVSLKGSLLDLTENVIRLRRQLRDIEIQAETQMQSRIAQSEEKHADAGFDPLEFDRFTRFQELTRMMAESVNDVATVQQNLLKNLDDANAAILAQSRMNRQLQQELMSVRMVPFASQAERLYRIVRQTGKELGKRANLEIRGGQVELDRSVLDKIGAPLEHLLRNAVAHGLETRDKRLAAGKTEFGEVTVTLAQEGNEIILTMADDGAGLDFERIRARGIEAGLISANEEVDEGRLIKLIFTPGFSTATEINQIAGRGIGMDVVKTEIGELGGRIEVHSVAGEGTTFRLYIPLTLAVTQALLVRAGTHLYAIPSSMIEQVLELKDTFLARIREAGETSWMGNIYPYRFLPHLLGDAGALPEARRQYWVLLLRSGSQRVAVQVDELQGNREIVVKNIGQQLARVVGIDGATVLGDGRVVLILNPVALSSRARIQHAAEPAAAPAEQAPAEEAAVAATLPTVMVVDDSLTVRKITGRLLAREGYQVLTAKDGVDALEQMLDVVPDVLLVDIEMPRMDGFDLTRNVRADDKLKKIPIIMITSRTADKHRNYAFEIGVNNYLGKPYQEEELMQLVAEYTKAKRH